VIGYGSGLAYGFAEIEAPLVGGLAGAGQVVATNLADAQGTFGKPWVPKVWPTNGELINTATGSTAIILPMLSYAGHGRFLQSHPKTRVAVLAYGIVTLAAGWLIPGLVRWLSGGVFRAGGRRGGARAGRYAYIGNEPLRADQATFSDAYGSGITSQANQTVLRRLFTSQ